MFIQSTNIKAITGNRISTHVSSLYQLLRLYLNFSVWHHTYMHLVFAHFSFMVFFRRPDPPIVGASDIGQGSIYFTYYFKYT